MKTLLAFICCIILCFSFPHSVVNASSVAINDFDRVPVMTDLESIDGFKLSDYMYNENAALEVVSFVEYCYSFKSELKPLYGLYLYIYNPSAQELSMTAKHKLQLATAYDADGNVTRYDKFDVVALSESTGESSKLFYKLKVIDTVGHDNKTIQERVNSVERVYDVSGIELVANGAANAQELNISNTYKFIGFSKGCGADAETDTLKCDIKELETVELDVRSTNFRTGTSAAGKDYQNDLTSVYFAVPRSLLEKYGNLQNITAEFYEYKTNNILVTNTQSVYNGFAPLLGVNIGQYDSNIPVSFSVLEGASGLDTVYKYSYNKRLGFINIAHYSSRDPMSQLDWLFYSEGDMNNAKITASALANYAYEYSAAHLGGERLPIKDGSISADLFKTVVDTGRTRGHNRISVELGDTFDLNSYKDNNNWWNTLVDFGRWWDLPNLDDSYKNIAPIYEVTTLDMTAADLPKKLLINTTDADVFKAYYNTSDKADNATFLFRFGMRNYYSVAADVRPGGEGKAYLANATVFLDFDILTLTFSRDGVYKSIPAVSSPIDIFPELTPPPEREPTLIFIVIMAAVAVLGGALLIVFSRR